MKTIEKLIYTICIGIFLVGFNILFSWTENSKTFGFILILLSSIIVYFTYLKFNKNISDYPKKINIKNIVFGALLIIIDVSYNLLTFGEFGSLDMGMLGSGIVIIILNSGKITFLKLTDKMISFSTYFLFLVIVIYAFVFSIPRPLFIDQLSNLSGKTAALFLNFIKPTTTEVVINYPNLNNLMVNFDGSIVGVGNACSGAAMLTVFIAAIIAFYFSSEKREVKKLLIHISMGIVIFYFINVLRIIMLMLINRYYGSEIMYFFHINLGWILFVVGMGVFWYYEFDEL